MIFPGHLGAGFLTTYAVIELSPLAAGLTTHEQAMLFILGTILGCGPDSDILFFFVTRKTFSPQKLSDHRKFLTHAPVLWLIAGLAIFFASYLLNAGPTWETLGILVWLSPWSHFICDSIDSGIMWLWPFSKKQYAIYNSQETLDAHHVPAPKNWPQLFIGYLKNPLAYIEIAVAVVALCVAGNAFL